MWSGMGRRRSRMLTRKVGERLCGLPAGIGRVPLKFTEQQPMIWWFVYSVSVTK